MSPEKQYFWRGRLLYPNRPGDPALAAFMEHATTHIYTERIADPKVWAAAFAETDLAHAMAAPSSDKRR